MRRDAGEHRLRPLQVAEHGVAEDVFAVAGLATRRRARLWSRRREVDEPLRLRHREGPQQRLIEQGKNGGVGADAQPQREHRHRRDERRPGERAERVLQGAHEAGVERCPVGMTGLRLGHPRPGKWFGVASGRWPLAFVAFIRHALGRLFWCHSSVRANEVAPCVSEPC